jgi:hypothetical protein
LVGLLFVRDKADFTALSPRFADPFGADYVAQNDVIAALPTVQSVNTEIKSATARIKASIQLLIPEINKLENFIKLAAEALPIAVNGFGIKQVRAAFSPSKAPELGMATHNLMTIVRANLAPLTNVGVTPAFLTAIENRVKAITDDALLQHQIISSRGQLAQDNTVQFDAFKTTMKAVMDTGKALYKRTNPTKTKDYTLSELKRKHRVSKNPTTPPAPPATE